MFQYLHAKSRMNDRSRSILAPFQHSLAQNWGKDFFGQKPTESTIDFS